MIDDYVLYGSIEDGNGFGVRMLVRRPAAVSALIAGLDNVKRGTDYSTDYDRERYILSGTQDECLRLLKLQAARLDPQTAKQRAITRATFIQAFTDAGITAIYVEETANGYSAVGDEEATLRRPWYIVTTPFGRITLGWRRHVISVEWKDSECKLDGGDLKGNGIEDGDGSDGYVATHWATGCHCYGYGKLTMVLKQLAEAVKP